MTLWTLVPVLVALGGSPGATPPDLEACLEQIRLRGMSEVAEGELRSVASIQIGHALLEFSEDPGSGRLWPAFVSTTCSLPGADPEATAKWKAELAAETDKEIERLRPLADTDGSGFVSTEEGREFRRRYEFGALAARAGEINGPGLDPICRASGLDPASAAEQLADYQALVRAAAAAGITTFPSIEE